MSLKDGMWLLMNLDHQIIRSMTILQMAFTWKSHFSQMTHSRFYFYFFTCLFLCFTPIIPFQCFPLIVKLFQASKKQFFKRYFTINNQIIQPLLIILLPSLVNLYLVSIFIKLNSKWVCCSKKLFEDLKGVATKFVATYNLSFLIR